MYSANSSRDSREDRLRQGDRAALVELLQEQSDPLHRWIERRLDHRLQGRLSASDVVQETYLAAEQRLAHFGRLDSMPFGVWVRLIAGQRLADLHRRYLGTQVRDASLEVPIDAGSGSNTLAARLTADITTPSQAAVRHEAADHLSRAMARLAPADREVLELRHFADLSNDDIAARLGLTRCAATKRHLRALARLKAVLDELHSPSDFQA